MAKVVGRLILEFLANGNVRTVFMPTIGSGNSRPLLARDASQAEHDLITTFGFHPSKAQEHIAELQEKGQVDLVVTIDEGLASSLLKQR